MKKILLLIATTGLLLGAISCSGDDEPRKGNGIVNLNSLMVNHVYNPHSDEVMELASTRNKLVIDTLKHQATLEFSYNDGTGDKTLTLNDLTATAKRLRFYVLSSPSNPTFSGYVDFNEEASMRYQYTTAEGIRIISMTPKVFFHKTDNTITYDDTTKATKLENVMYQFYVMPASKTALVEVSYIVHAKHNRMFNNITAFGVPYTVTPNGFTFSGKNIETNATYIARYDSAAVVPGVVPGEKSTTEYPFKTFNATVDLVNDYLEANYMLGSSATVVATGRTYPNYTEY